MLHTEEYLYDITKEYGRMFRVTVYKKERNVHQMYENLNKYRNPNQTPKNPEDNLQRSIRRTKVIIRDLILNNDFEMFVTFTFDPNNIHVKDRYNKLSTYLLMRTWLKKQVRKHENFAYIIVPEFHKDGAIHFHALIKNYTDKIKRSGVIQNNKMVYNLTGFPYGFTNAQYLDEDLIKTSAYIMKYITKDMDTVSNQRRYWRSDNLQLPLKHYNRTYDLGIQSSLSAKNLIFETPHHAMYEIKKPEF